MSLNSSVVDNRLSVELLCVDGLHMLYTCAAAVVVVAVVGEGINTVRGDGRPLGTAAYSTASTIPLIRSDPRSDSNGSGDACLELLLLECSDCVGSKLVATDVVLLLLFGLGLLCIPVQQQQQQQQQQQRM